MTLVSYNKEKGMDKNGKKSCVFGNVSCVGDDIQLCRGTDTVFLWNTGNQAGIGESGGCNRTFFPEKITGFYDINCEDYISGVFVREYVIADL